MSDSPQFYASNLIGEILSIFDRMPMLPGKLVFFALIGLSIVSWAIIASKWLLLYRYKKADQAFKTQLRNSENCLDLFEQDLSFEPSLLFDIYDEGARAASIELVGSPEPSDLSRKQAEAPKYLKTNQLNFVLDALDEGERYGASQLKEGFRLLKIIDIAAPLFGAVGACWLLIASLSAEGEAFQLMMSFALMIVATSLLVSAPAGLARIHLLNRFRRYAISARYFRKKLSRAFVDTFEKPTSIDQPLAANHQPPKPQEPELSEYNAVASQAPKIDFLKALVPDVEQKPLHFPSPKNAASPYISADY